MLTGLKGINVIAIDPRKMVDAILRTCGRLGWKWVFLRQLLYLGDEVDDAEWFGNDVILN